MLDYPRSHSCVRQTENQDKIYTTKAIQTFNKMTPIDFPESNFTFKRPADMTPEECGDLLVFKGLDTLGLPIIISCWELSEEDKIRIAETGKVWLTICGNGMPPVGLGTAKPFDS